MAANVPCPASDLLRDVLAGLVDDPAGGTVVAHLETCSRCTTLAATFDRSSTLTAPLQSIGEPPIAETSQNTQLMDRLKRLWQNRESKPDPVEHVVRSCLTAAESSDELGRIAQYRVRRHIGSGGMGVVFAAEDQKLQRPVALKFLHPRYEGDATARERFLAEARSTAAIRHDRVAAVYEVADGPGLPFIAMELLEGETLDARLRREKRLPAVEAARIGREISEGLAAAHSRGLLHRDIKPSNIWLESGTNRVRLLDFGLARPDTVNGRMTSTGIVVGTPGFIAPEQFNGTAVDGRADLFALGCILYWAVTGESPFAAETPLATMHALANRRPPAVHTLNPEISLQFSEFIGSLIEKSSEKRPASAADAATALGRMNPVAAGSRPIRGRRALSLATAVMLLAVPLIVVRMKNKEGGPIAVDVPKAPGTEIVQRPNPVEVKNSPPRIINVGDLKQEDISPYERTVAGFGKTKKAPPELVAVLGDSRLKHWVNQPTALSYHPSGNRIVSAAEDGIRVWDARTGEQIQHVENVSTGGYSFAAYAQDGSSLVGIRGVSPAPARQIFFADSTAGMMRTTIPVDSPGVRIAQVSRCGKWIAIASGRFVHSVTVLSLPDGTTRIRLPALPEDEKHHYFPGHRPFAFSPDGKYLVLGGSEKTIRIFDLVSGTQVHSIDGRSHQVMFSDDGSRLLAQRHTDVRVWEVNGWKPVKTIISPIGINYCGAAIHPKNRDVIAINVRSETDSLIQFHELETGRIRKTPSFQSDRGSRLMAFSPDGTRIAIAPLSGIIRMFETATGADATPIGVHAEGSRVMAIAAAESGRSIWTADLDGYIRRHQFGRPAEVFFQDSGLCKSIWLDRKEETLVAAYRLRPNPVLDATSMPAKVVSTLEGEICARSADGTTMLRCQSGALFLKQMGERRERRLQLPGPVVSETCALSPSGRLFATKCLEAGPIANGGSVLMGSCLDTEPCQKLEFRDAVSVVFSQDESTIAAVNSTLLGIFDVPTGRRRFLGFVAEGIERVLFSPDGAHVAVTSRTGHLRLFNAVTGNLVREIRIGPNGLGGSVPAFFPDGRHVAIGNCNGTIHIYRLENPPK